MAKKKKPKPTASNSDENNERKDRGGKQEPPHLVPQPHGGALLSGGLPGNRGGPGRPPSELRARMRGSLAERLHVAEEIADDHEARPADRLRALDLLARHGLPHGIELTGADGGPLDVTAWTGAARAELLAAVRHEGPERFAVRLAELAAEDDPEGNLSN